MQKYIVKYRDNTIGITTLISDTIQNAVTKMNIGANKTNPITDYYELEKDIILPTREYRNAWRLNDQNKIYTDLNHAKEIHLANLNEEKTKHLKEYSELYIMAAIEGADDVADDIAKTIKALHSIAEDMNKRNIETVDDLRGYIPDVLTKTPDKEKTKASIAMSLEKKKNEVTAFENALKSKEAEFEGAINAIKGFMMLLPDIQKTLNQINEKLDDKLDKNIQ